MNHVIITILLFALVNISFGKVLPHQEKNIRSNGEQEIKDNSHEASSIKKGVGSINRYFRRIFNYDSTANDDPVIKTLKKRSLQCPIDRSLQCNRKVLEERIINLLGPKLNTLSRFSEKFPPLHEIYKRDSKILIPNNRFYLPIIQLNDEVTDVKMDSSQMYGNDDFHWTKRDLPSEDKFVNPNREHPLNGLNLKQGERHIHPLDSEESDNIDYFEVNEKQNEGPNDGLKLKTPYYSDTKKLINAAKPAPAKQLEQTFKQISKREAMNEVSDEGTNRSSIRGPANAKNLETLLKDGEVVMNQSDLKSDDVKVKEDSQRTKRDVQQQQSEDKKDNPSDIQEEINKVYQDISDNVKLLSKLQEKSSQGGGSPRIMKRSFSVPLPIGGSKRLPRCSQEMTVEMDTNRDATPDKLEHIERKTAEEILQVNIPLKCGSN